LRERWSLARISGQESFVLSTPSVELAITVTGGQLAPVTFFPQSPNPLKPYAIAPWSEEPLPPNTPPVIAGLRGDFFCSAFGANEEPHQGRHLPLHGETANGKWQGIAHGESKAGVWMRLGIDLPTQGGRCEATTALVNEHSLVYQRHDFSGLTGPINPGHHATLTVPDIPRAARLSFSELMFAHTYLESLEHAVPQGASYLKPNIEIKDLRCVPCRDGSNSDLTCYPDRHGFDDIAIVCAVPRLSLAWSAITVPTEAYVWFALRNAAQLASTLLWFSNGGRCDAPWNARHRNVLGVEDMTGFFHVGLAASVRKNLLNERGVRTFLEPGADGRLSIPYIQGIARIPPNFDCVMDIESVPASDEIVLRAQSGAVVRTACHVAFLRTGQLPALELR